MPKTCTKCHETKPLGAFSRDAQMTDGRGSHCRACRAAASRQYWRRLGSPPSEEMLDEMLARAQRAIAAGMWRGPEAIRAYRLFREAVAWFVPVNLPAEEPTESAPRCTCPSWPCPRHAEEVQAA